MKSFNDTEKKEFVELVSSRRKAGETITNILKDYDVSSPTYYAWTQKFRTKSQTKVNKVNQPKQIAFPVMTSASRGVFVFYGSPEEVTAVVKALQ